MADPAYIYDPDEWEYTYNWADRGDLAEVCRGLRHARDVKRFGTLIKGPPKFAALVPITSDEEGEPNRTELRWFDTEAEARAACGTPAYISRRLIGD